MCEYAKLASLLLTHSRRSLFCFSFFPVDVGQAGLTSEPAHPPILIPAPHLGQFTDSPVRQIIIDHRVVPLLQYLHV